MSHCGLTNLRLLFQRPHGSLSLELYAQVSPRVLEKSRFSPSHPITMRLEHPPSLLTLDCHYGLVLGYRRCWSLRLALLSWPYPDYDAIHCPLLYARHSCLLGNKVLAPPLPYSSRYLPCFTPLTQQLLLRPHSTLLHRRPPRSR